MAHKYPGSWKNCATCSFWSGTRETDYWGNWVTIESATAKGKCLCRTSGWVRMDKSASKSCNSYDQWAPLKK